MSTLQNNKMFGSYLKLFFVYFSTSIFRIDIHRHNINDKWNETYVYSSLERN